MVTKNAFSRRRFLQTSALLTAGGVLAACAAPVAPAAAPAAGDAAAPAGEIVELTYMTPIASWKIGPRKCWSTASTHA